MVLYIVIGSPKHLQHVFDFTDLHTLMPSVNIYRTIDNELLIGTISKQTQ